MGKLKLIMVVVMTLTLTVTSTVHSNAKSCSATDSTNIDKLALAFTKTTIYKTEQKRYNTLAATLATATFYAKSAKLKTKLRQFYTESFNEVSVSGELSIVGRTSDIMSEIKDMKKYSRC
jgi:hypothetical protein